MQTYSLSNMARGSYLACMQCGRTTSLLSERKFICPDCGGLYDVEHEFEMLSRYLVDELGPSSQSLYERLKDIFDRRARHGHYNSAVQYRSGVWRFKELIMPFLPDEYIVTLEEGNAPIVKAGQNLSKWVGSDDLWLILEGMTQTGSFKDFGMTVMMSIAKAAGIKSVLCASTGDTSASASAYAAPAEISCSVITPEGLITPVQLVQPYGYGARMITLPGDFDQCMNVVKELVAQGLAFPANSLNPARIEGHQATVFLIAQYFNWTLPDWIAVPVGNGSNCSSIGKALRLLKDIGYPGKTSQILGAQSAAANPLSASWTETESKDGEVNTENWLSNYRPLTVGETTATAARIGNPVSRAKVMREIVSSNGIMNTAAEADLNEAVRICGLDGRSVCPQTGIALAGVRKAIAEKRIRPGEKVVVVSTAVGMKFVEAAAKGLERDIIKAPDCKTETVAKIISR